MNGTWLLPRSNTHEIRSVVTGFLTPLYVGKDPAGRTVNAFTDPEDMKRIASGYACGNCCATFKTFQLECPVCHLATNVSGQATAPPDDWQQFYDEHNNSSGTTQTRGAEEFLHAVSKDKDIDQVPLRKLKPSRHGIGAPK